MKNRNLFVFLFVITAFFILWGSASAQERSAMTINGSPAIVSGSSYCDEYEDIKFNPGQAFNGRADRPWMAEGNFNPKKPDWLKVTFTKPVGLKALRIAPGFGHSSKYFYNYSRLKKFKVVLEKPVKGGAKTDVRTYYRRFDGAPYKDLVLIFPNVPTVKSIKVVPLQVYPGKKSKYALIGNIEPVLVREGKTYCSSSAVSDVLSFLRSTHSAEAAFSFIPGGKTIQIKKLIRNANPLDKSSQIKRSYNLTRGQLRQKWDVWANLCQTLYHDYTFNTYDSVNYFWTDKASKVIYFDMFGPDFSDVMNSYIFSMTRQKVTEKIKTKDKDTGKEKEETITVLKSVINKIVVVSDVYTP